MKANWSLLLILLCSFTEQTTAQRDVCPSWFVPDNKSSTGCSCHSSYTEVTCGTDFPLLHLGYCMTYNSTTGITEYGPCPYIAHYNITTSFDRVFYIQLPSNVSLLNEFMCGPLSREGELCGNREDGYATPTLHTPAAMEVVAPCPTHWCCKCLVHANQTSKHRSVS